MEELIELVITIIGGILVISMCFLVILACIYGIIFFIKEIRDEF